MLDKLKSMLNEMKIDDVDIVECVEPPAPLSTQIVKEYNDSSGRAFCRLLRLMKNGEPYSRIEMRRKENWALVSSFRQIQEFAGWRTFWENQCKIGLISQRERDLRTYWYIRDCIGLKEIEYLAAKISAEAPCVSDTQNAEAMLNSVKE